MAGWTPLHGVAYRNRIAAMRSLLMAGADPGLYAGSGATPLEIATRSRNLKAQEVLTEAMRKAKHGWNIVGRDEVSYTRDVGGRELSELYNFAARQRTSLVRNLETDAEHQQREDFKTLPFEELRKAARELRRLGGRDYTNTVCKAKKRISFGL